MTYRQAVNKIEFLFDPERGKMWVGLLSSKREEFEVARELTKQEIRNLKNMIKELEQGGLKL